MKKLIRKNAYIIYEWPLIDFGDGKKMFLTLAQAICCCLTHDPVWKDNVLSDMLDEMFQIPGEWLRDNVASFLLFCNESVSLNYYISLFC